jgi:hypothetical protein
MIKQTTPALRAGASVKQVENTALESYEAKQAEIRKLLKQIEQGLEQHDRRASSLVGHHWGHVGDLMSIAEVLTDIKDRLHLTGEYANVS